MPRVKKFNEAEALEKSLVLFWEKGYESTSLSDLTEHLGIGKGSFYDTFGSKKELFKKALDNYRSNGLKMVDQLLKEGKDPIEKITSLLNHHTKMMVSDPNAKGCFLANSTTELSNDNEIRSYIEEHNSLMKSKIMNCFKDYKSDKTSSELADLILTQLTGISVLSKFINDENRIEASNKLFIELIK